MKRFTQLALSLLTLAAGNQAFAQQGLWLTQNGNLEVDIAPCGDALCGTVVKVLANRAMSGGPSTGFKDTRSPLGMKLLQDFRSDDGKEWKGRIYNREDGETYDCILSLAVTGELNVRGYKGMRLFGKTHTWTRVAK